MSSSPTDVVRKFADRLDTSIEHHRELLLAIHGKKRQASLESLLSEQFALITAVMWEVFLSDLLIAYVVQSPASYFSKLSARMKQALRDKYGIAAARYASIKPPGKISVAAAPAVIDHRDFNITVGSADALGTKATELLAAKYAQRFALNQEDAEFFDFVYALRNYLSHRSKASREKLNQSVDGLSGTNADLKAPLGSSVGAYLKGAGSTGIPRTIFIADRLTVIARSFV